MADEEKDKRASEPEVQASLGSLNLEAPEMVKIRPASIMGMTKAEQDDKTIRFVKNGKRREAHKRKGKVPRRRRGPRKTFDGILDWAPSGGQTWGGECVLQVVLEGCEANVVVLGVPHIADDLVGP